MLFILHNNVVLSLFLRAFYTVFCILYTYFLHISYTFYTYFSHFIHFYCYFSSNIARLWPNITHFRVFLTHFRAFLMRFCVFFPSISYNFLYICTNIACISLHTCTALHFASFFIFCTFVQTFSTYYTKLHSRSAQLFWHICTNFFQLAAALFPACEKPCNNLFPAFLQDFTASYSFFLCDYSFFLPFRFCFYCFFHS